MEELLLKLKSLDVRVGVADDNLKLSIPENVDESLFIEEVRHYKAELIHYLKTHQDTKAQFSNIPKVQENSIVRLTPAQERMYIFQEMVKDSIAYNIPVVIEIIGPLDKDILQESLQTLVNRHESLRTYFELDENHQPVQKVLSNLDYMMDYSSCEEDEVNDIIANFSRPFQLNQAPLWRASLVQVNSEKFMFLIDFHHIITDGVSTEIFVNDLMNLYSGRVLPEQTLQYRDYANWYFSPQHQEFVEKQRTFWKTELEGYLKKVTLPLDHDRPKKLSFDGKILSYNIDSQRKKVLDDVCKTTESSLFVVLLSIFGILQSKLTGAEDVVIGTPVAGRRHSQLQRVIGMFVNTLPLRVKPKKENAFSDYLREVRLNTLECFDNQEFPYEQIVEELKLNRDNDSNPFINTVISLHNIEQTELKINDLQIKALEVEKFTSKFDLTLHFKEEKDTLNCSFEYNTALLEERTIDQLFNYLVNIIDQISDNLSIRLGEISLLDANSQTNLLNVNNFVGTGFPEHETIISLFEKQVEKTSDKVALTYKDTSLTYKELNARANKLASLLQANGVQRGQVIGLAMEKTADVVVGMLGILKAGGAYLPIDLSHPQQRIDYIVKNSELKIMLTSEDVELQLADNAINKLYFEDAMNQDTVDNPILINSPRDLCYVLYTSGTTGNPKGVMIEHLNVVRLFFNDKFQFEFDENDVWTMFHSHCFDISVWELYGALLRGGEVIIIPPEISREPKTYLDMVKQKGVTVLNQTPTGFYNLLAEAKKTSFEFPNVRYVVFGGEALSPSRLKEWAEANPKCKLINMYGITETTVHTTFKEIGTQEIETNTSNLGRPLPTVSVYLLDEDLKPVPKGVIGEIYVGGEGVGRGYLNNEELTQSRFLKNPFHENVRLYRSGDLAVQLENDELVYKGRCDHQVQLRGFRIELGEIEHHLNEHTSIENTVVIVKHDDKEQPYLCAYFVSEQELSVEHLRAYLQERVPSYMIPSYFIKIESIPYTVNNKVAKNLLPEPVIQELSNYKAPETKEQQKIAKIWEEHLKVETVGINDNFFALGGDSIKAIGLVSKMNDALNASLSIADIYSNSTVAELSEYLKTANVSSKNILQAKEIIAEFQEKYAEKTGENEAYEAIYPMNGVEKGMIFHSLKGKSVAESDQIDDIVYHEHVSFQIPNEKFDFSIFSKAVELLVEKHAVFRKVFDLENQAHIVLKNIEPDVDYLDASDVFEKDIPAYIKEVREKGIRKKTGLSFSVLWSITVVKFKTYHYLIFNFHHSLLDGWSLHAFQAELSEVSAALIENDLFVPQPLEVSYYDQIVHETAATLSEDNKAFWKKEFDGYQRFELPKTGQAHQQKTKLHSLGDEFKAPLEKLAMKYNTSVKHLCFAAYVFAMKMISFKDDFTVGFTTNNRPVKQGGEKLLGCFLNTLPFRTRIPAGLHWGEYISYIDGKLKELKKYDSMPLYKVVEIVGDVTNDQNPMFDVFFNYIDFHVLDDLADQITDWGDIDYYNFLVTNNPLEMHFDAFQNKLNLWVTYSTSVIDEEVAFKLATYVKNVFKAFIEHEDQLVDQQFVLGTPEMNSLYNMGTSEIENISGKTVISEFQQCVKKSPKALAIVFEEEFMSYEDLDLLSTEWAGALMQNGVKKGNIVSLYMDRSVEMIVAMLSIMKCGAAYLPLNPDQPEAISNRMLEESESVCTITNRDISSESVLANHNCIHFERLNEYKITEVSLSLPEQDDLAYVIYTSGSTGQSKGVMVNHKNIINLISFESKDLGLNENDKILQFSPYYFDVSVQQIWLALTTGARLVLVSKEKLADPFEFVRYVEAQKITMLNMTPSYLEKLDIPSSDYLRIIATSGEECKPELARKYVPTYDFYNEYGPTETTVICTKAKITTTHLEKSKLPIGKPIPNTTAYILDESLNFMPEGFTGELYMSGACVAEGYLNRADLTKELFIENPHGDGLLYKTGDMARWNKDGDLEYMGRKDEQVKFNGIRIEPEEIEASLKIMEGIDDALAVVKEIEGKKYFVSYYLSNEPIPEDRIREHLLNYIPVSIIPTHFMRLETFPLTANGKLDKNNLPLPEIARREFEPPKTSIEIQLAQIWAELLGMKEDAISIYDTFFELGGNSLNAITLSNKILKTFSVEFTIKDVFIKQTIKGIADYIATVHQMSSTGETEFENAKLIL
ncbi:amino acid adenylation domain-containing protein [Flavobacteriaceae bacterium M23B6Z8]